VKFNNHDEGSAGIHAISPDTPTSVWMINFFEKINYKAKLNDQRQAW